MAKGFINISTSGNGDLRYFARENECTYILSSANISSDRNELLHQWKSIEQQEKFGDKALGIRGRHDAQVRKNYILSLPNELTPQQGAERVKNLVEQTPIKHCSYSIFVHRGEKEGIVNQHVHLIVNERNLETMKKDREMIKKEFLERTIRPLFEKEFAHERGQGKTYSPRERIEESLFHADLSHSKIMVKGLTQEVVQSQEGLKSARVEASKEAPPEPQYDFSVFERLAAVIEEREQAAPKILSKQEVKEEPVTAQRDAAQQQKDPYYQKWEEHKIAVEKSNMAGKELNESKRAYWLREQQKWDKQEKGFQDRAKAERDRLLVLLDKKNFFGFKSSEAKDAEIKIGILDGKINRLSLSEDYESYYYRYIRGEPSTARPIIPEASFREDKEPLGFKEFKEQEIQKEQKEQAASLKKEQDRGLDFSW